jgi:hypothetical protein
MILLDKLFIRLVKITYLIAATFLSSAALATEPLNYVDTSIGVINSRWFYNSPVSVPNGLVAGGPKIKLSKLKFVKNILYSN